MSGQCDEIEERIKANLKHQINNLLQIQKSRDALLHQKIDNMREIVESDIQEHHNSLYGNGKDGLTDRVTRIEESRKASHRVYAAIATGLGVAIGWLGLGK